MQFKVSKETIKNKAKINDMKTKINSNVAKADSFIKPK